MRRDARYLNSCTVNRLAIGHILHHRDHTQGRDFTKVSSHFPASPTCVSSPPHPVGLDNPSIVGVANQ